MERESFEDEEVAELLNNYFVSIKVDREERPDIDSIYMSFCQALTGQGGWPLTIFMTPDKKPFYAGTYFPKGNKYGRAGLMELLRQINKLWENERQKLIASSEKILETVEDSMHFSEKREIGKETIDKTFDELDYFFDPVYGGIGNAPKFPTPHNLMFLLRYWKSNKNEEALKMVEKALVSMYKGGIFDHIGFGFSRYSVDEKWLVPHFEKMLYDNALLAIVYLEAYQATKQTIYKDVVEKIFSYVLRDMTSPEGGFYSAEDADSEGEEGKFYVWTVDEIKSVLGEEDGALFSKYYDITKGGNFEGKSIPNLIETDPYIFQEDLELKEQFENMIEQLFDYREKRTHPHKDDKILTSWNGLMIAALAYGGRVLKNERYIEASKKSVDFIYNNLVNEEGRLLARYRDGESAYLAYLDDYAFMIWGLVELYETTFEVTFLDRALKLTNDMIRLYWDDNDGGFFLYGEDNEQLIIRPKSLYDGAIPSGNSVAAYNMLRLSKITGKIGFRDMVITMFSTFGGEVNKNPNAYTYFIMTLLYTYKDSKEVVIAGEKEEKDTKNLISIVNKEFLPFVTTVLNDGSYDLHNLIPFTINQGKIEKKATAYVCENFTCNQPTTEVEKLNELLLN